MKDDNQNSLSILQKTLLFLFFFFLSSIITLVIFITVLYMIKTQPPQTITTIPEESKTKLSTNSSPFLIKASIPYWDHEKAKESFEKNIEKINYINLFWYFIDENGKIKKYEYAPDDDEIISLAHENNIKVLAVIANLPEDGSWDSKRVEEIINFKRKREVHINSIKTLLNEKKIDGIIIDYEEVAISAKNDFTLFIKELSLSLHEENKEVSVALHPKNGNLSYEKEKGSGSQDWKELSKFADHLHIMGYGQHWDEGEAGPIASISWLKDIAEYAKSQKIDGKKFFLGLPLYGYDWNKDNDEKAKGLVHEDISKIEKEFGARDKWDQKSLSPFIKYVDDNDEVHEVWFENARSIAAKIKIAEEYGFGGITLWRLGGEDTEIWSVLSQ